MDDAVITAQGADDGVRQLAASLPHAPEGVDLTYRVLRDVVARHHFDDASMVVRAGCLGVQIFRHGRLAAPGTTVAHLVRQPPGIYAGVGHLPVATGKELAGICGVALAAAAWPLTAAVDPDSGLTSRAAIDAAIARSVARASRYDWACTLVMLGTAGDRDPRGRWDALSSAVRTAVRSGDEAGVAGHGRAVVVVGGVGPDVLRPLVGRVRAALTAGGNGEIDVLAASASAPHETVDPRELWRLAAERLAEVLPAPTTSEPRSEASLELALRMEPGVACVGMECTTGTSRAVTVVTTSVPDAAAERALRRLVDEHRAGMAVVVDHATSDTSPGAGTGVGADAHKGAASPVKASHDEREAARDRQMAMAVNGNHQAAGGTAGGTAGDRPPVPVAAVASAPGSPPGTGRVALVSASFDPTSGTSEVRLARGSGRATGRAAAGPLAGGAQATLSALAGLGATVPFYLVSAERARTVPGDPVVVVLARRRSAGDDPRAALPERIGVAAGTDDVEAAARAALSALNRDLVVDGERGGSA